MKRLILFLLMSLALVTSAEAQMTKVKWSALDQTTIPQNVKELASAPVGIVSTMTVIISQVEPIERVSTVNATETSLLTFPTITFNSNTGVLLYFNGLSQEPEYDFNVISSHSLSLLVRPVAIGTRIQVIKLR